jgi:hypothetical protein
MKRNKNKEQAYKSIGEFEKEFFPKSFRKLPLGAPNEARNLGTNLAIESLDKIRTRLSK